MLSKRYSYAKLNSKRIEEERRRIFGLGKATAQWFRGGKRWAICGGCCSYRLFVSYRRSPTCAASWFCSGYAPRRPSTCTCCGSVWRIFSTRSSASLSSWSSAATTAAMWRTPMRSSFTRYFHDFEKMNIHFISFHLLFILEN